MRQPVRRAAGQSRRACVAAIVIFGLVISTASAAGAQDESSVLPDVLKRVVLDPTTYAPSILSYESQRLDWDSSQVFFRNGFTEHNPDFTISGYPDDVPVSYGAGNRKIIRASLLVLDASVVNNVSDQVIENLLIRKRPTHRRLFRVLGWAERISVASYLSYQASVLHFRQWQLNRQVANQLGY